MPEDLDVQSLRIVRAIADAGTITAAATALGYSQPAVSQHVRRLERRLGTALLERRGIAHTEISVEDHPELRQELLAKSGRRTLPQVYVGGQYIGGADELAALDRSGELLKLIQARNDDG